MKLSSYLLATLLSGLGIAILSTVEFTSTLNLFFCGWVWLGVIFSVSHYNRLVQYQPAAKPAEGALIGATTGVIASLVFSVLTYFRMQTFEIEELLEEMAGIFEFPIEDFYATLPSWDLPLEGTLSIMGLFSNLFIFIFIGLVAGTITATVLSRRLDLIRQVKERMENENNTNGSERE